MYHLDFCMPFELFWWMLHTVEHVPLRVLAYPQRLTPCWGRGGLLYRWWTYPVTVVADLADAGAPSDTLWLPIMLEPRVLAAWKVVAPRVEPLCCRRCCAPAPSRPRLWLCLLYGWSPQIFVMEHPEGFVLSALVYQPV